MTPHAPSAPGCRPTLPHCHYALLTFLCKGRPTRENFNKSQKADCAMTMAAVSESQVAGTLTRSSVSPIVRVKILHDMGEAEATWRKLEYPPQFATPYQRFDFQAAWQKHVGGHEGLRPFIVIAYDVEHQPLLLVPLAVACENGMRIAKFLGGKHVTFN